MQFGSLSPTGVFTANQAMEQTFNWLGTQEELGFYQGSYAPENAFRAVG